jgi:hypothetical protein
MEGRADQLAWLDRVDGGMTDLEYAKHHATADRYAERVRQEERKRVFDMIEVKVYSIEREKKPGWQRAATAMWELAGDIMREPVRR